MASLDGSYIDSEGMKQDLNKLLHLSCSVFYLYLMYFDWTKLTWPDRPIVGRYVHKIGSFSIPIALLFFQFQLTKL